MNILSSENFNNIIFILVPGFITTNLIDIISPPKKYREFIYVVKCLFYGLLICFITKCIQPKNIEPKNGYIIVQEDIGIGNEISDYCFETGQVITVK